MDKIVGGAASVLRTQLSDGMTVAAGGFGVSGVPFDLIEAVRDSGVRDLTIVSNNMGIDGVGLGLLLESGQVARMIVSYAGENRLLAQLLAERRVAIEFVPQGTLAERLRAGGAGIAGFYTPTGAGTEIADGKPTMEFDGRMHLLELAITADIALVRAHRADAAGNLTYRYTARNFNPIVATAGRFTIAEAEEIVPEGDIDPNVVVTPGIFVQAVVLATPRVKPIERVTVRPRTTSVDA